MRLSAPEWAPQVAPPGVAWMRQKKDPAMSAARHPRTHLRPRSQDRPQHHVVLLHENCNLALAVPIPTELEVFLNFDYEKPSVSLTILMFLHTVLVLPNRRLAVERVATRIFFFCGGLCSFTGRIYRFLPEKKRGLVQLSPFYRINLSEHGRSIYVSAIAYGCSGPIDPTSGALNPERIRTNRHNES